MIPRFSIIIPCYNEALNLPEIISQLELLVKKEKIEFILVNNGSTDNSLEILTGIFTPNIYVVNLEKNSGYGGGIKAGLQQAQGEFIGWIHADLQYSVVDSLSNLNNLCDGAKFLKGRRYGRTFVQSTISMAMSVYESILFGKCLFEINAQPTIFDKELLNFMKNVPNDFSIDLYVYLLALKHNYVIKRIRVNFIKRQYGNSSWNSGIKSVFLMSMKTMRLSIKLRRLL
jgi:glycosyltransferase involved in cell wall biosynthesis